MSSAGVSFQLWKQKRLNVIGFLHLWKDKMDEMNNYQIENFRVCFFVTLIIRFMK